MSFRPSSPIGRGSGLKRRPVLVRTQGGVPENVVLTRVAQLAEAAGRDPVQCWFESIREYQLDNRANIAVRRYLDNISFLSYKPQFSFFDKYQCIR